MIDKVLKVYSLLFLLFVAACSSNSQNKLRGYLRYSNYLEKNNLKGKVNVIEEKRYFIGKQKNTAFFLSHTITTLDTFGNIKSVENLDKNGQFLRKKLYAYDSTKNQLIITDKEKGEITKRVNHLVDGYIDRADIFDEKGNLEGKVSNKHKNGKMVRQHFFDKDGSPKLIFRFEYDGDQLIKYVIEDPRDKTSTTTTTKYQVDGNVTKTTSETLSIRKSFNRNLKSKDNLEKVETQYNQEKTTDGNGNVIKIFEVVKEKGKQERRSTTKITYTYDAQKNWVQKIEVESNNRKDPKTLKTSRKIKYY